MRRSLFCPGELARSVESSVDWAVVAGGAAGASLENDGRYNDAYPNLPFSLTQFDAVKDLYFGKHMQVYPR